ncbi:hypothetical protein SAMN04487959_11547 [Modicisalibacter xianhensis]|uniref:Uncharacterized protein n=2 Tax=Modicisalibacter xianhensis TaxID=442341 RepID=A0A1I3EXH8_9GAMM|nr:hypothetical protein SAMN04487959_11547 [Halomonas xianhensis]
MERGKTLLLATLALSGVLLVGCGDDETTGTDTSVESTVDAQEVGNDAAVSTGTTGTTSGITGSDMVEPDESTGEGLSPNDQMPVSDPSAQPSQPSQQTPERQSTGTPAGGGQSGVSQASSTSNSQSASEQ